MVLEIMVVHWVVYTNIPDLFNKLGIEKTQVLSLKKKEFVKLVEYFQELIMNQCVSAGGKSI